MSNRVAPESTASAMNKSDPKNQYIAAGVVSGVATLTIGMVLGFSAILLPQLEEEQYLTADEKSWIASLSNIGQLGGAVGTGILSGKFGRRYTIMMLCVPLIAGWALIGLSKGKVLYICCGRILQGIGVMSSVTQVYLVEIADTARRGIFGASGAMSVSAGITVIYILGALLPWRIVCIVSGLVPVAVLILMVPLPETPPWLVLNGRKEEAETSLSWLRGSAYDVSAEIESLLAAQGKQKSNNSLSDTLKTLFTYPGAYKPFIILMIVFLLQQLTGTYAVIFYAVNLFKDIGVSTNPYAPAIITGLIRLIGTLVGTALLKHFGRKPLMIVSGILMGIFMVSLAATLHFKDKFAPCYTNGTLNMSLVESTNEIDCSKLESQVFRNFLDFYPALAVVLYMLAFGSGVGTVPWLLLGELCPSKVKAVASGITVFVAFITIFVVVKAFPFMLSFLGAPTTYGIYAVACFLIAVYTWFFVPETRGKSLAEIQTIFGTLD